jgi:hypothetical protein
MEFAKNNVPKPRVKAQPSQANLNGNHRNTTDNNNDDNQDIDNGLEDHLFSNGIRNSTNRG